MMIRKIELMLLTGMAFMTFVGAGCIAGVRLDAGDSQPVFNGDVDELDETLKFNRQNELAATSGQGAQVAQASAPAATKVTNEPTNEPNQMTNRKSYSFPGVLPAERINGKTVTITTSKGEIVFKLLSDVAPKTVSNFVYLAEDGYFDGLKFHRVVSGFVIQGGDPSGDGTGGPGYSFEDEPVSQPYLKGTVAMANRGPDTNGSQFFICLEDLPTLLPDYTIFGQVVSGMETVSQIAIGDVMSKVEVK